jgi:hypothetical protein
VWQADGLPTPRLPRRAHRPISRGWRAHGPTSSAPVSRSGRADQQSSAAPKEQPRRRDDHRSEPTTKNRTVPSANRKKPQTRCDRHKRDELVTRNTEGDASRERFRISRHRRKPFADSNLVRSVTRVTRVTRNRGPFPGGGCPGDQSRLFLPAETHPGNWTIPPRCFPMTRIWMRRCAPPKSSPPAIVLCPIRAWFRE